LSPPRARAIAAVVPWDDDELPVLTGRAWVFADRLRAAEIAADDVSLPFAPLSAEVASSIREGDIVVAGSEFACGEGAVRAARALHRAGVSAVIARSFASEFWNEALRLGFPTVVVDEPQSIRTGDHVRLDIEGRRIVDLSSGDRIPIRELDEAILAAWRAARKGSE
jgi:3-isopropylmalate dehydratase small subunit